MGPQTPLESSQIQETALSQRQSGVPNRDAMYVRDTLDSRALLYIDHWRGTRMGLLHVIDARHFARGSRAIADGPWGAIAKKAAPTREADRAAVRGLSRGIVRDGEDPGYRKITAVTNVPVETVMSTLARARGAMRRRPQQETVGAFRAVP